MSTNVLDKRMILSAALGLAAAFPAVRSRVEVTHRSSGPLFPPRDRRRERELERAWRLRHKITELQSRGWPEIPCTEPAGYFWKQDRAGRRLWRLYRLPAKGRS